MSTFKALIVDDDQEYVSTLKELLERSAITVVTAYSGEQALEEFKNNPDIRFALIDLVMPMMDGITLLEKLKKADSDLNVIMITGQGTVSNAVEALKKGASDFITKPFDKDVLLSKLEIFKKSYELENKVEELSNIISTKYGFDKIISSSKAMKSVFEKASAAASTDATIFIVGETGTGKELLAKCIHLKSERNNYPFIPINCGAIPKELLESELFGHKKGSFTGAVKDNQGLFLSAHRGTIFLDEIGEMPKDLQVRLLRVLQEYKIRPVGSSTEIPIDTRLIAASNHSIEDLKNKELREDLFFRLAVVVVEIPPLRERKEDIPILIDHFINIFNHKYDKNISGMDEKVLSILYNYDFPGNVRELENLLEGLIVLSPTDKKFINEKDLKASLVWRDTKPQTQSILSLEKVERFAIENAIRQSEGNKSKAAELLGVSRDTLYRKLKQYNLE
ncbi:MAG: sigma-54-dependent Fis family transcriptional regulator [Candidatus Dadabacteria bacterium]|nr:sigma-54-dependent Fis family transcriptional regulator [Candidatus Dadabacteria bacterium]NIS08018.1 sigma-54-dependent Fis family transcriptional regulator [Candidatus Dadabacteria bacterium]NIV40802.1 response regulator [Candidatus Dadabacteria bacterium]NIX15049.1 response regulator [Candidatus Dadabacteria bacterium]NIY21588.1 response regulator [Candidatus Dadabacteria bacterium]